MGPRKKLRYLYYRAVRNHGKPREVALGVAIGVAVGITPVIGHTPIAVAIAALTGQSKMAAAAGVWINNPITFPFVYGAGYALGALVLGYPLHPPGGLVAAFTHLSSLTGGVLLPAWVGSLLLAGPLAAISYWVAYQAVVAYRLRKSRRREARLHRWHWTPEAGWHRVSAEGAGAEESP